MLQKNSKATRPTASASTTGLVQFPVVLLSGALVDAMLNAVIERVCVSCRASIFSLESACKNGLPAGARPCLIVSLLPLGERRVPVEVSNAVANSFPGLPVLLLCQEQLTRPSVSVEDGRVILIGQPFTEDKIAAHIRSIVDSLPPIASRSRSDPTARKHIAKVVRGANAPQLPTGLSRKYILCGLALLLVVGVYAIFNFALVQTSADVTAINPKDVAKQKQERLQEPLGSSPPRVETLNKPILPHFISLELAAGETVVLVLVPAGTFQMGSPANELGRGDDDESSHIETIPSAFYLSKFEVTQGAYAALMGTNPSQFKDPRKPVETVSYFDASDFCEKATAQTGKIVRLPSETEWEYACRAGTQTPFTFGETLTDDQANIDGNDQTPTQREPVVGGSYAGNSFGLFDMHGNVSEWCRTSTDKNGLKVLRGGSWNLTARHARSAARHLYQPGGKNSDFGFRIVVEPPSTEQEARHLKQNK